MLLCSVASEDLAVEFLQPNPQQPQQMHDPYFGGF